MSAELDPRPASTTAVSFGCLRLPIEGIDADKFRRISANTYSLDCSKIVALTPALLRTLCFLSASCSESNVTLFLKALHPRIIEELQSLSLDDLFHWDGEPATTCRVLAGGPDHSRLKDVFACRVPATVRGVIDAQGGFDDRLRGLGFSETTIYALKSLYYEIAMNIAIHAQVPLDDTILFLARIYERRVILAFADHGIEFDVTTHRPSVCSEATTITGVKHGFGIPIIYSLAQQLVYRRLNTETNSLMIVRETEEIK